jgi:hypothetical protein
LRTNIKGIFELAKHISIELDYIGAKFGISNANISESNETNPTENPAKLVFEYTRKVEEQTTYISENLEEENIIKQSPMSVYYSALRKFQIKIKNIEKQNKNNG